MNPQTKADLLVARVAERIFAQRVGSLECGDGEGVVRLEVEYALSAARVFAERTIELYDGMPIDAVEALDDIETRLIALDEQLGAIRNAIDNIAGPTVA